MVSGEKRSELKGRFLRFTPDEYLQGCRAMELRGLVAALSASFTLMAAVPAAAQSIRSDHAGPIDRPRTIMSPRSNAPSFQMPDGDFRQSGEPRRNGLIASVPVNRSLEVGVGRFRVSEIAGPRTYTESDRPAATGPRQRSIAGVGFSLRFD